MNLLLTILAYLLPSVIGYLALKELLRAEKGTDPFLLLFLAPGAGFIFTAYTLFASLLVFDQINWPAAIIAHFLTALSLGLWSYRRQKSRPSKTTSPQRMDWICLAVLCVFFIPIWIYAHTYPMGGWDAWQVWNFKAKFLYLGAENWKNMLEPTQWRSSPHYPLFLPLIVAWGWIWNGSAVFTAPLFVSTVYTFLCGGLLFAGLKHRTQSRQALWAGAALISLPLFVQFGTSQYCDALLGYYLLASLICSMAAYKNKSSAFALLSGAFAGALSFTKPEGAIATLLLAGLNILYLKSGASWAQNKRILSSCITALLIFALPAVIFTTAFSPGNQTFINGLTSADKPSTLLRLQFILAGMGASLTGRHWAFFWIVMLLGILLGWKKCINRSLWILPGFLAAYLAVIIFYYWLNTYFDIAWWMKNTLNRILFSLLPVIVFWAFTCLHTEQEQKKS